MLIENLKYLIIFFNSTYTQVNTVVSVSKSKNRAGIGRINLLTFNKYNLSRIKYYKSGVNIFTLGIKFGSVEIN